MENYSLMALFFTVIILLPIIIIRNNVKSKKSILENGFKESESLPKKEVLKNRKKWTKEEFFVLAHYVIYEKGKFNDPKIVESLAEGMGRSLASVEKKISILNNINNFSQGVHTLERKIYFELFDNDIYYSYKKLDESVEIIIKNNPQI